MRRDVIGVLGLLGIAGAILVLHHYSNYGRLQDKNKELCHGKVGLLLLLASALVPLFLKKGE